MSVRARLRTLLAQRQSEYTCWKCCLRYREYSRSTLTTSSYQQPAAATQTQNGQALTKKALHNFQTENRNTTNPEFISQLSQQIVVTDISNQQTRKTSGKSSLRSLEARSLPPSISQDVGDDYCGIRDRGLLGKDGCGERPFSQELGTSVVSRKAPQSTSPQVAERAQHVGHSPRSSRHLTILPDPGRFPNTRKNLGDRRRQNFRATLGKLRIRKIGGSLIRKIPPSTIQIKRTLSNEWQRIENEEALDNTFDLLSGWLAESNVSPHSSPSLTRESRESVSSQTVLRDSISNVYHQGSQFSNVAESIVPKQPHSRILSSERTSVSNPQRPRKFSTATFHTDTVCDTFLPASYSHCDSSQANECSLTYLHQVNLPYLQTSLIYNHHLRLAKSISGSI